MTASSRTLTHAKLRAAYADLRAVLEATWPPRWRLVKRRHHRQAIKALEGLARAADVDPQGWVRPASRP